MPKRKPERFWLRFCSFNMFQVVDSWNFSYLNLRLKIHFFINGAISLKRKVIAVNRAKASETWLTSAMISGTKMHSYNIATLVKIDHTGAPDLRPQDLQVNGIPGPGKYVLTTADTSIITIEPCIFVHPLLIMCALHLSNNKKANSTGFHLTRFLAVCKKPGRYR